MGVGGAAGRAEPAGTGARGPGLERPPGLARTSIQLAGAARRLAGSNRWVRGCGHDAGAGVLPALSQLPKCGAGTARPGLSGSPGDRATSGNRAADLYHWCRHCAAVVPRRSAEPAGVGLGAGQWVDGCGFVAVLADAQGLRAPSGAVRRFDLPPIGPIRRPVACGPTATRQSPLQTPQTCCCTTPALATRTPAPAPLTPTPRAPARKTPAPR